MKHLSSRRNRKKSRSDFSDWQLITNNLQLLLSVVGCMLLVGNFALQNSPSSGEWKGKSPNLPILRIGNARFNFVLPLRSSGGCCRIERFCSTSFRCKRPEKSESHPNVPNESEFIKSYSGVFGSFGCIRRFGSRSERSERRLVTNHFASRIGWKAKPQRVKVP